VKNLVKYYRNESKLKDREPKEDLYKIKTKTNYRKRLEKLKEDIIFNTENHISIFDSPNPKSKDEEFVQRVLHHT